MWIAVFSIVGLVVGWTVCALLITAKKGDLEMEMFELRKKHDEVLVDIDSLSVDLDELKKKVVELSTTKNEVFDYDL
jgi:hypothetical protein